MPKKLYMIQIIRGRVSLQTRKIQISTEIKDERKQNSSLNLTSLTPNNSMVERDYSKRLDLNYVQICTIT